MANVDLEQKIVSKGKEIFSQMGDSSAGIFNKDWWYGRIMDWSMQNEKFKVQMFRFVDVLPYLNSSEEVTRHLKEYFASAGQELPSVFGWGLGLSSLAPGLLAGSVKKNVTQMAKMFICGSTPEEAFPVLEKLRKENMTFTVDILGEATVSEAESRDYFNRYMDLIDKLADRSEQWTTVEQIDTDHLGPIPKINVSVKVSALDCQMDPLNFENSIANVKEKLRPIFRRAKERGVFLNLDMESYFHKDLTLAVFKSLADEEEFRNYPHFGIVIQAYLKDSENDLQNLIEWLKKRKTPITVRLVKGAYWDYETVTAQSKGWPIPVFTEKGQTDANYERLTLTLLENANLIRSAFGSHNIRSVSHAIIQSQRLGVNPKAFEIQMLFGMAEPIKKALVKQGFRVREYAPVGELIPGMAYLVRRLLENTSNESFLRAKFTTTTSPEELLKDPNLKVTNGKSENLKPPFINEPPLDFNKSQEREAFASALKKVRSQLGANYPLVIGKKEIKTKREIVSVDPSDPKIIIGRVSLAGASEADQAVEAATEAKKAWSTVSPNDRAAILDKAALIMRRRKYELCALEVFEAGKTWREADGDVGEAIDFCTYYATEMRRLGKPQLTQFVPGEECFLHYQPRGVALVIAPWNFPLAILTGMTAAALVTGNTVIMKPAEQTPVIAFKLMEIFREAGLPAGALNFLPGLGEEVGEYLVNHHKVDLIAFTGSKDVGLHIVQSAGHTHRGQKSIKKVIAELGGKNAIIVDSDADLDEAVLGTLQSAFGFQGQKCSACSRVIVLEENYSKFVHRLVEAARSRRVGSPDLPSTDLGPVIDEESQKRILSMIETGKKEAKLLYQSDTPKEGFYVPLTIFEGSDPNSVLAQEEIFGPVLLIMKAKTFDEALRLANSTAFALTGGVYSRSPAHLEQAKREFEVGNLYINRGITGALVQRHPFGGFKMSGIGSKAGGPDYLLQFVEPKVISENTLRRGFAPPVELEENP